jgi:hypothetical protein
MKKFKTYLNESKEKYSLVDMDEASAKVAIGLAKKAGLKPESNKHDNGTNVTVIGPIEKVSKYVKSLPNESQFVRGQYSTIEESYFSKDETAEVVEEPTWFEDKFLTAPVYEDADVSLRKKADKTGIPFGILKQVFNRGKAAWRTGHRPGTTPDQWGHARVNSFATKSKGTWGGADKDLAAKVRGSKK